VPDNQPDATDGHRVDFDVVPMWLEMYSDDPSQDAGSFSLTFPSSVKLWRPDPNSTEDNWGWIEVTSGEGFDLTSWKDWYIHSNWQVAEMPGFLID
jgi:hypothetical protein